MGHHIEILSVQPEQETQSLDEEKELEDDATEYVDIATKKGDFITEHEKAVLTEMLEWKEKHFGSSKKNMQIDVLM